MEPDPQWKVVYKETLYGILKVEKVISRYLSVLNEAVLGIMLLQITKIMSDCYYILKLEFACFLLIIDK